MVHIGKLACVAIHNLYNNFYIKKLLYRKRDNLQCKKNGATTSSHTPYDSNKSAFQLMKLSSWTWASLRRRLLLLIMWPVFEKLLSEVALDAGTHNVCLAIMVNSGHRI